MTRRKICTIKHVLQAAEHDAAVAKKQRKDDKAQADNDVSPLLRTLLTGITSVPNKVLKDYLCKWNESHSDRAQSTTGKREQLQRRVHNTKL
jgi:hypothetical protein